MTYNPPSGDQSGQDWPGQGQYQTQQQYENMQQWQPQPYQVPPMQQQVEPKNPAVSVLISVFVPGVGSIVNGSTNTGVLILVLYFVAVFFSLILIGIPFAIGIWIWGLVDAYQTAQEWNAAHGIIS